MASPAKFPGIVLKVFSEEGLPGIWRLWKNVVLRCFGSFMYVDFPMEGDWVGHDYVKIIGWCYFNGREIESVRAEMVGSGKTMELRLGIFRPDVAVVFPHLKFTNVGFEGELYPWTGGGGNIELRVVARTVGGFEHTIKKNLILDATITGLPVNRNFANSGMAQMINDEKINLCFDFET